MTNSNAPAIFVHDPAGGAKLVERLRGAKPLFCCVAAYTAVCEVPGISAAGAAPDLRRFTAPADLETLVHGRPRCLEGVPINPLGPPSPVVITLGALRLAQIPFQFADAGLLVQADAPCHRLGNSPGRDIRSGLAVSNASDLFVAGKELGRELGAQADYLVIGETVPGGTTTALAVLLALGLDARGKVSSSSKDNPHDLKGALVDEALQQAWPGGLPAELPPLEVVAAVGDPMQPAVAGMALGAIERCPVILAGGTQMAAVLALMVALGERGDWTTHGLAVCTTRWVAEDPSADLAGLAAQIDAAPFLAANLNFASARHAGLRRYEEFLVKEGVGAGGIALAAMLKTGFGPDLMRESVEAICDELLDH